MIEDIKTGRHIFSRGNPDIKLIKTRDNQRLVFDDHHSMLAYMAAGMTHLEEVPHRIIFDKAKGYVEDKDIVVFYGEYAADIENYNWKEKMISWQTAKERQIFKRAQKNMR